MTRLESARNQARKKVRGLHVGWVGTALSADWKRPARSRLL